MEEKEADIEIFELAISREVKAVQFYLALADYYANTDMRQVFIEVAKEEMKHKDSLELEIQKMGHTIQIQDWPELSVNDSLTSETFSSPDIGYKDFLLLAIAKEDAAFKFYIDMLSSADNQESREVILAIAEEEVKHKYRFETEYEMLLNKK